MAEKKVLKDTQGEKIGRAIDAVLQTEAGRIFWAHLFRVCGYNVSSLTRQVHSGEIAALSTECKEAQRLVYINLRKMASRDLLVAAEDVAEDPAIAFFSASDSSSPSQS